MNVGANKPVNILRKVNIETRKAEAEKLQNGGFFKAGMSKTTAKAQVGKYEVNWEVVQNQKNTAGKPMFNIAREKYFSWLVGHSKEFMDQMRYEIAEDLAKAKVAKLNAVKSTEVADKEKLTSGYKEKLGDKSASDLLKVRKQAYVESEQFFATAGKRTWKNTLERAKADPRFEAFTSEEKVAFRNNFFAKVASLSDRDQGDESKVWGKAQAAFKEVQAQKKST